MLRLDLLAAVARDQGRRRSGSSVLLRNTTAPLAKAAWNPLIVPVGHRSRRAASAWVRPSSWHSSFLENPPEVFARQRPYRNLSDSVILTLSDTRYNTVMKNGERSLWTIDELSGRVALALRAGYAGVPSGRVRDVPDLRTIRYYTTIGLLDRPAAMQGRTALYGHRHLLQLVAIKRLQARGLSLAAVQERVIGLSNTALGRIAAVPVLKSKDRDVNNFPEKPSFAPRKSSFRGAKGDNDFRAAPTPDPSQARGDSFWRLPAQTQASSGQVAALNAAPCTLGPDQAALPAAAAESHTIPLGNGLVLSLATRRGIDAEDIRSIRLAAASLIEVLRLRGLIKSDTDADKETDTGPQKPGDAR